MHILRAALTVIGMVDSKRETAGTLSSAHAIHPSDGTFDHSDYIRGARILAQCGLLNNADGSITVTDEARWLRLLNEREALTILVDLLLTKDRPPWLPAAASYLLRWEYVPEDARASLMGLFPNQQERERFLLSVGRKYDDAVLRSLGEEGEEYVVSRCRDYLTEAGRPDLAAQVVRVSLVSDQLGYDVTTPDCSGHVMHLEVKTVGGHRDSARIFLSRGEATQGNDDPCWTLVVCERRSTGNISLRGWCRYESLEMGLPRDPGSKPDHSWGRWTQAELVLDADLLEPGLPLGPRWPDGMGRP